QGVQSFSAWSVDVALHVLVPLEDVADLRPAPDDARLEAANPVARAAVAAELLVDISDGTDLPLLGQELRRPPIEVHVDAILIVGMVIQKVVGEAERAREFIAGLRVEVGVGAADIDRVVAKAEIGERTALVIPDRTV